jgi:glycerol-1-phosphate dehydrogenase [NAD(P)+]
MDQRLRLGGDFQCVCGRTHTVPVRRLYYSADATDKVADILTETLGGRPPRKPAVVADARTQQICGERIAAALSCESIIVPDSTKESPVCDDTTCLWLKERIAEAAPDIIVAVGSGTINDLCKWAAFELDRPYVVAATAASMNGYAAANIAAKIRGVKVVLRGRAPLAVLAEPAVIERAPAQMTAAGFGDTIAKSCSKADWVLNNLLFGEHYCAYCADILDGIENTYLENAEKLRISDSQTVKALFEALFLAGIAMTMVGSSAPASGGEHLLSHVLDMTADINNQGHSLHGMQVGLGTIVAAALYEKIISIDEPSLHSMPAEIDSAYWQSEGLIESVREQYVSKQQAIASAGEKIRQGPFRQQLRERIEPLLRSPQEIRDLLARAGAAARLNDLGISRKRAAEALAHMHEIRSRLTVVDLAWLTGVLPGSIDEIIDRYLQ